MTKPFPKLQHQRPDGIGGIGAHCAIRQPVFVVQAEYEEKILLEGKEVLFLRTRGSDLYRFLEGPSSG